MSVNNLVLIGNLVEAPNVTVTAAGTVRTRFRIASTERRRDALTDSWQDGESVFLQVTCWRRLAENVGNSLEKGDRVIVCGRLRQWVAEKDGVRRTMHELDADAVGPDLQRGVVSVSRVRRAVASLGEAEERVLTAVGDADPEPPRDSGREEAGSNPADEELPGEAAGPGAGEWLPPLAELAG
jgi:single-strand DNA-binding protein